MAAESHKLGDASISSAPHSGASEPDASSDSSITSGEPEAPVGPSSPQPEVAQPGPEDDQPGPEDDQPGPEVAQPEPEDDHEAKLEHDLEELTAKAQRADEYLDLAKRTKADFENYRKRAAREAAAAQERGVVKLAKELLPAVDNLDRALEAALAVGNGDDLASGIKLVHADLIAALRRVGIEPFSPEGEAFDPTCQEAVAQQPCAGAQPGTVVEVYQRGYRLGETVLRPARVLVAGE